MPRWSPHQLRHLKGQPVKLRLIAKHMQTRKPTYSIVSVLFAALPFGAILTVRGDGPATATVDALHILCGITSLLSVAASLGYLLQTVLLGDVIELYEWDTKSANHAALTLLAGCPLWILRNLTTFTFWGSMLGLAGIFELSCWVYLSGWHAQRVWSIVIVSTLLVSGPGLITLFYNCGVCTTEMVRTV
jgi:hypothetical protein